jgi:Rieske 2Fe-2S family protein
MVTRDAEMNAKHEMLAELDRRRAGFTLGRRFYGDPEFHRLDLEAIHYREWLFAGHDCEIAEPGRYLTLQVGDYPVLVLRGHDGAVRAFHNTCRHRGSRICAAPKGKATRLVCPYHQWTYDFTGALLRARHMDAHLDKANFGLKPIHCETVGGYIFICLAQQAPDFAPFRADVESYLAPHRLTETKVAFESTIVENANWKLVWENNRECYHCAGNHPELIRTFPEAPTVSGVGGTLDDPLLGGHWDRCELAGLPSRFKISANGQHRVARVPLVDEAESYTLSGKSAVRRGLSEAVREPRIGSLLLFHYPTTWNHILGDHAISFRLLPVGPNETQLTTKWLVHKDAVEGVDYSIEELTEVWLATNDQDRRIVEENQIGVRSPAFEPGPYSPDHEDGVLQFVDWYSETMRRELAEGRAPLARAG